MDNYGDYVYKTEIIWLILVSFVFLIVFHVKINTKNNNRIKGDFGEEIACFYLKKQGFSIKERNYLKKWGEIDIIAIKDEMLQFFEVKSIIENPNNGGYRAEENVHALKIKRLKKAIQTYLEERGYGLGYLFKFHVITVRMNSVNNKIYIKMMENLIL